MDCRSVEERRCKGDCCVVLVIVLHQTSMELVCQYLALAEQNSHAIAILSLMEIWQKLVPFYHLCQNTRLCLHVIRVKMVLNPFGCEILSF